MNGVDVLLIALVLLAVPLIAYSVRRYEEALRAEMVEEAESWLEAIPQGWRVP